MKENIKHIQEVLETSTRVWSQEFKKSGTQQRLVKRNSSIFLGPDLVVNN